jgi:flavin-binding protein dodecin
MPRGIASIIAKAMRFRVSASRAFGRNYSARSVVMSVARIVEISSTSDKSFEDAIVQGIARASKTIREIRSAWVKEQEVTVQGNKVVAYKVTLKVTFVLEAAA